MEKFILLTNLMKNLLGAHMSLYDFEVETIDGKLIKLDEYKGKVLLIVNVASYCKFTSQYEDLQKLYEKYKSSGFEILAFPCNQFFNQEPNNNEQIKEFCSLNYQISFPIFSKIDVNGKNCHGLFKFLKNRLRGFLGTSAIKWNFTKFIIDKDGNVIQLQLQMIN